jgi:HD-GYP domain-containing protein (c-di-GMP phosphodiesterase class II)
MSDPRQTALLEFIRHLASAVTTAGIYPLEHRQVTHLCQQAVASLCQAIDTGNEISLQRIDDQIIFDGRPLGVGMYPARLAGMLKHRGIGSLKITRFVEQDEVIALIGGLAGKKGQGEISSSKNIRLGKVELRYARPDSTVISSTGSADQVPLPSGLTDADSAPDTDSDQEPSTVVLADAAPPPAEYTDLTEPQLARLAEIFAATRQRKRLHTVGISEIVGSFISAFIKEADPLLALAPLREMDEYTFTHSINVCILNLAQAAALGIDGPLLHDIGTSALLHDIGKQQIPEEILTKQEKLTEKEWALIRMHPQLGAQALLGSPGVPRLAVITAYEHHLRFDGTGYPPTRGHWEQNLSSQMTALSDAFDALSTHRPYRRGEELDITATNLRYMGGSQLHPLLTDNFLRLLKKYRPQTDIG